MSFTYILPLCSEGSITSILQIGKKLGKVHDLHKSIQWWSWNLNPSLHDSKVCAFNHYTPDLPLKETSH